MTGHGGERSQTNPQGSGQDAMVFLEKIKEKAN
jgi:hypothetical protein